jgi:hypothetical protein
MTSALFSMDLRE